MITPNKNLSSTQVGFTLLELMIVVMIMAILVMLAMPMYQSYMLRASQSQAQSESLRLAALITTWRARNLSYRNFNLLFQPQVKQSTSIGITENTLYLPLGSSSTNYKYQIRIIDLDSKKSLTDSGIDVTGRKYAIRAERSSNFPKLKNILLTSGGLRCMSSNDITNADFVNYTGCGTGAQTW
jgi:type IV pilus assembly protein PilE